MIAGASPDEILDRPVVLVVDDDQEMRRLIGLVLNQQFAVLEAGDGDEALQMLACPAWPAQSPQPIAAVLLDIMMPGIDGLSLCRRIKHEFRTAVIMCTARAEQQLVQAALRSGADDYVSKPFSPKTLIEKVSKYTQARA